MAESVRKDTAEMKQLKLTNDEYEALEAILSQYITSIQQSTYRQRMYASIILHHIREQEGDKNEGNK